MTRGWLACLLILVVVLTLACSGAKINTNIGDEALFKGGLAFFEKKNYGKAIEYFKELTTNHPESGYSPEAKLLLADAYFADRQYDQAVDAYYNFRGAHPTHAKIPYAVYRTGISYMQQLGAIDRDQGVAEKAVKELEGLLADFPSSEEAKEGREKLVQVRSYLAKRELYVGEFYHRQGKHNAALGRFYAVLEKYRETDVAARSLLLAAECHIELGEAELAKLALMALTDGNPRSPYAAEIKSLRARADGGLPKGKNEQKGFWARINPLNLFRSDSQEKEIDPEAYEDILAKRRAILASLNSRGKASIELPQRIDARPTKASRPAPVAIGEQASLSREDNLKHKLVTQGKSCTDCHQQAHADGLARLPTGSGEADGQSLGEDKESKSWFRRLFNWLGL